MPLGAFPESLCQVQISWVSCQAIQHCRLKMNVGNVGAHDKVSPRRFTLKRSFTSITCDGKADISQLLSVFIFCFLALSQQEKTVIIFHSHYTSKKIRMFFCLIVHLAVLFGYNGSYWLQNHYLIYHWTILTNLSFPPMYFYLFSCLIYNFNLVFILSRIPFHLYIYECYIYCIF